MENDKKNLETTCVFCLSKNVEIPKQISGEAAVMHVKCKDCGKKYKFAYQANSETNKLKILYENHSLYKEQLEKLYQTHIEKQSQEDFSFDSNIYNKLKIQLT